MPVRPGGRRRRGRGSAAGGRQARARAARAGIRCRQQAGSGDRHCDRVLDPAAARDRAGHVADRGTARPPAPAGARHGPQDAPRCERRRGDPGAARRPSGPPAPDRDRRGRAPAAAGPQRAAAKPSAGARLARVGKELRPTASAAPGAPCGTLPLWARSRSGSSAGAGSARSSPGGSPRPGRMSPAARPGSRSAPARFFSH